MNVADKVAIRLKAQLLSVPNSSLFSKARISSIETNKDCSKAEMLMDLEGVGKFSITIRQA